MAELLISVLGVPTVDWSSCPSLSELEVAMVNWVGRAFGLPEELLFHGNTETSKGGGIMPVRQIAIYGLRRDFRNRPRRPSSLP